MPILITGLVVFGLSVFLVGPVLALLLALFVMFTLLLIGPLLPYLIVAGLFILVAAVLPVWIILPGLCFASWWGFKKQGKLPRWLGGKPAETTM